MNKICNKCSILKPFHEFDFHSIGLFKLQSRCKDCRRADCRERKSSEIGKAITREWILKNEYRKRPLVRIRDNANNIIYRSIKNGKLEKQPCSVCGYKEAQAHHSDYNKPLEIIWLCRNHHWEWHKNNKPIYPQVA